ncbi:uncharacterized protein LOC131017192 [Salvia miltiorrhiza]|uniref:uncharacterized protein LOC131017192 n=1 Tax=Salvia miltiorrhiza TaxID=226208 RepID=UPI0025ABA61B|nr:uncharacterized protein LOC131017192 [Salvia miltiorrhiza]
MDSFFSGVVEIHVHHARNIHNICIYEKQDVYAKFSLTCNPDHTVSTRIINGGGRNPDFNDNLAIDISHPDAVLKCEIWMLSRAKNFMDDQLLGFVLVPISSLSANATLTQDFHLSSTDLFHSPAGTIKLSLFLNANTPTNPNPNPNPNPYPNPNPTPFVATSQLLSQDTIISDDYCRIEFPDVSVVDQNQQMVSEYFAKNGAPLRPWADGSFLRLGAAPEDYEMVANSSDESSSVQNSGMTSLSDDRNSADSMEKKGKKSEEENEESAMQQQIVDMYMRSMQQFTESLAKMKLPMDLEKAEGDVIHDESEKMSKDNNNDNNNNNNCRVFYGSRAFF